MAIKRDHHPERRTKQLSVRLTEAELDTIRTRASREGHSPSGLLATLGTSPPGRCTHHTRQAPDGLNRIESELAAIRRHLSGATNNLNQTVRWMHTHDAPPTGIEALASELSALATRVSTELTRLRRADG